ncbi:hypothetical protein QBC47DRAFT_22618 [Echria macrotheca]|uniref:C2H2-type domain-containing protein n=1 Tax=Echria macrotheca TaxID=438768 RepID=A0AAJ0FF97_9PEZI|nr:hypothetical protein QBC47DRAFT_22618 [Echria macrotheca]
MSPHNTVISHPKSLSFRHVPGLYQDSPRAFDCFLDTLPPHQLNFTSITSSRFVANMLMDPNCQNTTDYRQFSPSSSTYPTTHDPIPRAYSENVHLQSDIEQDLDGGYSARSLASSPISTQSLLSQCSGLQGSPLSAFQTVPAPKAAAYWGSLFDVSTQRSRPLFTDLTLLDSSDPMQTEQWTQVGHLTPRTAGRISHQRESSLSSLGSNGPASPFPQNFANPQIAVTDSSDGFHGLPSDDFYQLAPKFPAHDNFYTTYPPSFSTIDQSAYNQRLIGESIQKRKNDRSRIQPEHLIRSHPDSVASSVASDSPATPAEEPEEQRRQLLGGTVPKLDRTLTDALQDELYNPNLVITRAPPSQNTMSQSSGIFAQTLQAANSQHLSALQSPISATSRNQSPFQQGSPLAMAGHDFPPTFPSAHQLREQHKAYNARAAQQQMGRSMDTSTPQTISPKDAMLEFREAEGEHNFPLFPQQHGNDFGMDASMTKAMSQSQTAFDSLPLDTSFNYLGGSQLSSGIQVPQQYPFISQVRQQSSVPSLSNGSLATSRVGSAETGLESHNSSPQRPTSTSADGGTYTCTYHGCTLRFETPALLQKHKREGHRQAHGLGGTRRGDNASAGMTSSFLNSQAGPHRCDRINPSTGKPCNAVFSRPYDLTRHEDTIHNARKQKVRCQFCTDEKTFSRADALTRHYRVCHPDVELQGKHRRRPAQSG